MLVDISSSSTITGLSPDDAAAVKSNASLACKCLCRLEFAKEQPVAGADDSALNEAVVYPAIDAMVALLRRDVSTALSTTSVSLAVPTQSATATPVPPPLGSFPSDACIAVITSLGRMVQVSEKCKARANEQGVLPVLLDCLKVSGQLELHQVADKLLHLCILLPGDEEARQLTVNPRILSSEPLTVHQPDTSDCPPSDQALDETTPFLSPESVMVLLNIPPAPGDQRLLFRVVRWLAVLLESPRNARALGDSNSVEPFLQLLIETPPQSDLLFGFLSRCITAIVSQSGGACEVSDVVGSLTRTRFEYDTLTVWSTGVCMNSSAG